VIIGIDMGGTNIDGVAIHDGSLIKTVKHPVDRENYFFSIWHCLEELLQNIDPQNINRINLSTTICTNAIVENNISEVGVILQTGPGLKWVFEDLGSYLAYLSGSVDHRGIVVRDLDMKELAEIKENFSQNPIEALAIVNKFSTRNPEFEQRIHDFFKSDYEEITMGHQLSGKLNFPRRVQTAYLNAAVASTFRNFTNHMLEALAQKGITAPIYILKADGGTIDLKGALNKPVETILSGPAASFMGMRALFDDAQTDRCLIDIGGTTTDIFFLVDGTPVFEPTGIEIDRRKTLVRAIYSVSIGLGGDSHVRIEENTIKIGPKRLDAAVAFGGKHLTPTDALVYLGKMTGQYPDKSKDKLKEMAQEIGLEPKALALKIVSMVGQKIKETIEEILDQLNANPVYTIEKLLQDRRIKPQAVEMIGGPAQALAPYLEESLELPVFYPERYEVANAIGAALAKPTVEINMIADTERKILSVPELEIYEKIGKDYNLDKAQDYALELVSKAGTTLGLPQDQIEAEIVEASSFNMVQGYYGVDKNIRVKAQIKPGLLTKLKKEASSHES